MFNLIKSGSRNAVLIVNTHNREMFFSVASLASYAGILSNEVVAYFQSEEYLEDYGYNFRPQKEIVESIDNNGDLSTHNTRLVPISEAVKLLMSEAFNGNKIAKKAMKDLAALRFKNIWGGKWMRLSDREQIIRESFTGTPKYQVIDKWRQCYPKSWVTACLEGVDTSRSEYNALLGHYKPGTDEYEALKNHLDNLPLQDMITCRKTPFISEKWLNYDTRHKGCPTDDMIDAIVLIRGGTWL